MVDRSEERRSETEMAIHTNAATEMILVAQLEHPLAWYHCSVP